jgi:hypothetical protein
MKPGAGRLMRSGLLALRIVAAVLLAALGACARPPSLGSVLHDKYPGYQQVLPATSVSLRDRNYEFVPGTMLSAVQLKPASRSEVALWQADPIYCPPGYPLADTAFKSRPSTTVVYDFDFSLRRLLHLRKAKADLNLEENELEFVRHIAVRIDSPRTYSLRGRAPVPQYVKACLEAILKRPGIQKIRGIIVGNVSIDVLFKDNASVLAKWSVANKINSSLGVGVLNGEGYTIRGNDLVFGADLVRIKR